MQQFETPQNPKIDGAIIEEIQKSCKKIENFRPSDIQAVTGGFAVEVKDSAGNRDAIYFFDKTGKLDSVDAYQESLKKVAKTGKDVFIFKRSGKA